jgi:hypothetical protein
MEVCVSLVVGPLVADEFTFPTLSLAKGDSKMTIRKRSKEMCAVAICVGLALSQVLARAGHESQIDHIQLRQTTTEIIRPIEGSRLRLLGSLSEFASRLVPPTELPDYDWLQADNDVEEPPTLELATPDANSDAVVGDGQDWTSVLKLTKQTKKLKKLTQKTKEKVREATKYTWTITLTPEEEEPATNTDEEENEDEEEEDKAAQTVYDNQAQLATAEEQQLQQMVEEAASELTVYETQDDGVAYNRNDATERLAQVRRQMMLNFELDSIVLASF